MTFPPVTFNRRGVKRTVALAPRVTLLDALRERLDLPGTDREWQGPQCVRRLYRVGQWPARGLLSDVGHDGSGQRNDHPSR